MMKGIHIIFAIILTFAIFTGCTNPKEGNQEIKVDDQDVFMNTIYDPDDMVTMDGSEFYVNTDKKIIAEKELGFGVKLNDFMYDLKNEGKLEIYVFPNMLSLTYVTDDAANSMEGKNMEDMPEEEVFSLLESYADKTFEFIGIYRRNTMDPLSGKDYDIFANSFEVVEELASVEGNTYYLGYSKDYSQFALQGEEHVVLDTLLSGIDDFKNNIALFPSEDNSDQENVFPYNMEDFTAQTLSGETVTSDVFADYDLTMVNVWETWSDVCVEGMPELQKVYENLPKNVNMITVCSDGEEKKELAKEIINSVNGTFMILLPDKKLKESLVKELDAIPTTIFVDNKGVPVGASIVGIPDQEETVAEGYLAEIQERLENRNQK